MKNTIEKSISTITQKKKTQINKIINQRGYIITYTTDTQRIKGDYYEQLYAKNLTAQKRYNPRKIQFLERYNLPRLNHEERENLHKIITSKETEARNQKP